MKFKHRPYERIINEFADLGIYDYTHFMRLDFYKGGGTLYFKFWSEEYQEIDFCGDGTTEIIYQILKMTCLSDRLKRRRG